MSDDEDLTNLTDLDPFEHEDSDEVDEALAESLVEEIKEDKSSATFSGNVDDEAFSISGG